MESVSGPNVDSGPRLEGPPADVDEHPPRHSRELRVRPQSLRHAGVTAGLRLDPGGRKRGLNRAVPNVVRWYRIQVTLACKAARFVTVDPPYASRMRILEGPWTDGAAKARLSSSAPSAGAGTTPTAARWSTLSTGETLRAWNRAVGQVSRHELYRRPCPPVWHRPHFHPDDHEGRIPRSKPNVPGRTTCLCDRPCQDWWKDVGRKAASCFPATRPSIRSAMSTFSRRGPDRKTYEAEPGRVAPSSQSFGWPSYRSRLSFSVSKKKALSGSNSTATPVPDAIASSPLVSTTICSPVGVVR